MNPLAVDSLGMWEQATLLPDQVHEAHKAARDLPVDGLPRAGDIDGIVVLGMGGSGIAGDVLAAATGQHLRVPVTVVKSYELPAFVTPGTLVFAVSCSGNTEETTTAAEAAFARGARVVAVTGGGRLATLADAHGSLQVPVPATIPQPRAALGAMAIPPLILLERLGLLPDAGSWVDAAVDQLARRRDALVVPGSLAEQLAVRLGRTIPLVHGSSGLAGVAAQRWKTQVNENAKMPAFWSAQPELCHNEVAGWGQDGDVTRQLITLVALRHEGEHPRVARRFALIEDLLLEVVADVLEVRAEGEGVLARFFDLVLVGDFVSLHLASQQGVDPGPVPVLGEIKEALAT